MTSLTPVDSEEDPFACFGDEGSDSSSGCDNETTRRRSMERVRALSLVNDANNIKRSSPILPIRRPDNFEVFDTLNNTAGKGLRATRFYRCGEEILREVAAMRVPKVQAAYSRDQALAQHRNGILRSFDALHPHTQEAVMQLCSVDEIKDEDKTPQGVYDTNSFQIGGGNTEPKGGLFLTMARMNHSCRPSTNHFWRPDLQQFLVFATRDIAAGEELCTIYGPKECLATEKRRAYLQDRFSFRCMCSMCQEENTCGGDDRMQKIHSLQEQIDLLAVSGHTEEALEAVEQCLALLEEQGLGSGVFIKTILHYGYNMSMAANDIEGAQAYLSKELLAVRQSEGHDSPRAIEIDEQMQLLLHSDDV